MRRFLITGLPRIRSAWLAALFSDREVSCFHDGIHHGGVDGLLAKVDASEAAFTGLIDPAAACVYPRQALAMFGQSPIVVVMRDPADCRNGFERWFGRELANWDEMVKNLEWFMQEHARKFYAIDYASLDDHAAVSEMFKICTGLTLDRHRFDLFNTLKIEQHHGKAAQAFAQMCH